jgi:hypothetical protein
MVMGWPEYQRKDFYSLVKKARGEAAMRDLIEEVKNQWSTSQQQSRSLSRALPLQRDARSLPAVATS